MKPPWLTALAQSLPQALALAEVDSFTGEARFLLDLGLDDEIDVEAAFSTATDFSLGDEMLELQSMIRRNLATADGRREILLLCGRAVLLFVRDSVLAGSTLVVVCRPTANLGLLLAQVRRGLPSAAGEVVS